MLGVVGEAHRRSAERVLLGRLGDRAGEQRSDLVGVAAEHLGGAGDVVEAQEDVGDDEPALRHAGPSAGSGTVGSSFAMWS